MHWRWPGNLQLKGRNARHSPVQWMIRLERTMLIHRESQQ